MNYNLNCFYVDLDVMGIVKPSEDFKGMLWIIICIVMYALTKDNFIRS